MSVAVGSIVGGAIDVGVGVAVGGTVGGAMGVGVAVGGAIGVSVAVGGTIGVSFAVGVGVAIGGTMGVSLAVGVTVGKAVSAGVAVGGTMGVQVLVDLGRGVDVAGMGASEGMLSDTGSCSKSKGQVINAAEAQPLPTWLWPNSQLASAVRSSASNIVPLVICPSIRYCVPGPASKLRAFAFIVQRVTGVGVAEDVGVSAGETGGVFVPA